MPIANSTAVLGGHRLLSSGMSPVIEAAWIATVTGCVGIISTAVVALSGHRTTVKTSKRGLDAAHRERMWDRQADAYVNAIAGIRHQQKIRESRMSTIRFDPPAPAPASPVDWAELEPRLLAYASPSVIAALKAASDAGIKHRGFYDLYAAAAAQEKENNQLRPGTPGACRAARSDRHRTGGCGGVTSGGQRER
jgi:hypothetical protein